MYEMNLDAVIQLIQGLKLGICKADKTFRCHLGAKKDRKKSAILVATDPT